MRMKFKQTAYYIVGIIVSSLLLFIKFGASVSIPITAAPVNTTSIVFIKTHKTGGSTLSQILYRWGLRKNLYFAQYSDNWMKGGNIKVDKLMALPPDKSHYEIIAQHFRYDKEVLDTLFGEQQFIITIMRDPVERFCSTVNFLGIPIQVVKKINYLIKQKDPAFQRYDGVDLRNISLQDRITLLFEVIKKFDEEQSIQFFNSNRMFFNSIARDTGFPEDKCSPLVHASEDEVQDFIDTTDKTFDLVLIQEHFDKSMLVLAEALNMKQSDVLYMVENSKVKDIVIDSIENGNFFYTPQISTEMIAEIKKFSYLDVKIYEHFKKKFELQYQVSAEVLREYKFNLFKVYISCVCGRDNKGLFKTFSHILCEDKLHNLSCRELLTDSISIQYIAAAKQCKLTNTTCRSIVQLDEKIKHKSLLTKDWESKNSIDMDLLKN